MTSPELPHLYDHADDIRGPDAPATGAALICLVGLIGLIAASCIVIAAVLAI